jgi:salicylate hydroxylase
VLDRRLNTEAKVWEMRDIDPLPFWNRGRAIVIGDAAHAMTPMQGQGANLSIEDGESFRLLRNIDSDSVSAALAKIDSLRRPRATNILLSTRKLTTESTAEERAANMDYIAGYNGILSEIQKQ